MSDVIGVNATANVTGNATVNTKPRVRKLSKKHWVLVFLPLLLVVIPGIAYHEFVLHAVGSNPILNGIILLVMGWGAYMMFQHVYRIYHEYETFSSGMVWFHEGLEARSSGRELGPRAYILGMLERLEKLGLGHEVHVHSSTMEIEIEALEQYLIKKQEMAQYVVGLMVALGLLGTFVGLLETLVRTSTLIGTIAGNASGGGDMAAEFGKIVGGLQAPLEAMGTAFSASMFGLVGSIMLGFQMVIVRKAAQNMVESVRREVLSLSEKSTVESKAEISVQYLSMLLADILVAHRETSRGFEHLSKRLDSLIDEVQTTNSRANVLSLRLESHDTALSDTAKSFGNLATGIEELARFNEQSARYIGTTLELQQRAMSSLESLPGQISNFESRFGSLGMQLVDISSTSLELAKRLEEHEELLGKTHSELVAVNKTVNSTVGSTIASMDALVNTSTDVANAVKDANSMTQEIVAHMPAQSNFLQEMNRTMARIDSLKTVVKSLQVNIAALRQEVRTNV